MQEDKHCRLQRSRCARPKRFPWVANEEMVGPFCKSDVRKVGGIVGVGADTGVLLPRPFGRTHPYLPMASSCKCLLLSDLGG